MSQAVGRTIIEQMGGAGRIMAMTGTKKFLTKEDGVVFRFPNRGGGPNAVEVTLAAATDTYEVKFFRIRGSTCEVATHHEDIYAEDLKGLFERETGLFLSL